MQNTKYMFMEDNKLDQMELILLSRFIFCVCPSWARVFNLANPRAGSRMESVHGVSLWVWSRVPAPPHLPRPGQVLAPSCPPRSSCTSAPPCLFGCIHVPALSHPSRSGHMSDQLPHPYPAICWCNLVLRAMLSSPWGSWNFLRFGSREAAINIVTTLLSPNFQACGRLCGLYDMALQAKSGPQGRLSTPALEETSAIKTKGLLISIFFFSKEAMSLLV